MHTYSMRGCPRERYVFYISLIAVAIIAIARQTAGYFGVIITVTTLTVFGILFFVFDRWLWRQPKLVPIVGIPNLSGAWNVSGKTEGADGNEREWNGTAHIEQTWSRIAISIQTGISRSRSAVAAIERDPGHGIRLVYGYMNDPKTINEELQSHKGTCEIVFSDDLKSAEATYFNDHQRRTCGTMVWKRAQE